MAKLSLPPPDPNLVSSLPDGEAARAWLATQSMSQPLRMLRALLHEIRAIDASVVEPHRRMEILAILHAAVIQAEEGAVVRYAHKPLPLLPDEFDAFENARRLWQSLAVAYLRAAPLLPPSQLLLALHRGAACLRESLYCHYLAAIEVATENLNLIYELLVTAESLGIQRLPVNDPEFGLRKDASIAGEVAWALLLNFCDPYRFTPAQLAVANRGFSRWCDLASFQAQPDEDTHRSKALPLARWPGAEDVAEGGPKWLEVRPVIRKIRKRVEALQAGETPEQLRLGRDLSASACIKLMNILDLALRPKVQPVGDRFEQATVDLVFSHTHLYQLLAGKPLEENELSSKSATISHDRVAVFGFDNAANRGDVVVNTQVPAEPWAVEEHWILRAAPAGNQVVSPLLVGIRPREDEEAPVLAILFGLRQTSDGWLAARLRRLPMPAATGIYSVPVATAMKGVQRQAAFLLPADAKQEMPVSICLPTGSGVREGVFMSLGESPVEHLRVGEMLERGSNFIRFTYTRT